MYTYLNAFYLRFDGADYILVPVHMDLTVGQGHQYGLEAPCGQVQKGHSGDWSRQISRP